MEATGYAAPTMATDGVRAYAIFATGDVVAVTLDGQEVWHKNLGIPKNHYGHASSLATYQDLLIIQLDQAHEEDGLSRLVALRGATGEVAWEVKRPVPCSWASPIVVRARRSMDGDHQCQSLADRLFAGGWQRALAGQVLGGEVGPSPVFVDGVVYAANDASGLAAVRADGTGDVTRHARPVEDRHRRARYLQSVGDRQVRPVVDARHAGLLRSRAGDGAGGRRSEEREPLWEEDLLEEVSSSPSQVGNLVYLFSEEGKAWIVEPQADACKRVGEFEMGEPVRSSPAFQPGRIYIRGQEHLICIGTK